MEKRRRKDAGRLCSVKQYITTQNGISCFEGIQYLST